MDHKLLVVTFSQDLPQFQMFCYCLAKNWHGQKNLIVVLNTNTDQDLVKTIVDTVFDSSWTVELHPTICSYHSGDLEQQINKIYHSVQSGTHDVIVFDSKDFLLRPRDVSVFKKANRYRVTYKLANKKLIDMGYDMTKLLDVAVDHFPAVSNLTPWIWNVGQLTQYWNYLNERFGNYQHWKEFSGGNEIYGYYLYTWANPARPVEFLTHPEMPLLIAGGWTHQTYQGMCQQALDFDQEPTRIVWKHSRKLQDSRCLDVTKSVLAKNGIDPAVIKQVYG
jgi:hypothetical protein